MLVHVVGMDPMLPPCVCTSIGELEDLYSTFDDVVDPRSTTSFISGDVVDPVQPEVLFVAKNSFC